MEILKIKNKTDEVLYKNEFIDNVIFNYDKRMLILFLFLVYKFQNESIITVELSEVKKALNASRKKNQEIKEIVEKLYDTKIYYKTTEKIIENEKIIANIGDYIEEHIFDILVFSTDGKTLNFKIKEKYIKYFINLKDNFSKTSISLIKELNSTQILLYLYFNRWKNYDGEVESDWKHFKLNMGYSKGYKNNDVIRRLDKALIQIEEKTGMKIKYDLIRSPNKRAILKIKFNINEDYKKLKKMLKSNIEMERKIAQIALKRLEKNNWKEEE